MTSLLVLVLFFTEFFFIFIDGLSGCSGILNCFLGNLLRVFKFIQRFVRGFNTFPSGHILTPDGFAAFTEGLSSIYNALVLLFLTYTTKRSPLLNEKHKSFTFITSRIHFFWFRQKLLSLLIFQSYFISSQGILISKTAASALPLFDGLTLYNSFIILGSIVLLVHPLYTYLPPLQVIPVIACNPILGSSIFQLFNNMESCTYSSLSKTITSSKFLRLFIFFKLCI